MAQEPTTIWGDNNRKHGIKKRMWLEWNFYRRDQNPPGFQYPIRRAQNWATVNQDPPANREG